MNYTISQQTSKYRQEYDGNKARVDRSPIGGVVLGRLRTVLRSLLALPMEATGKQLRERQNSRAARFHGFEAV